MPEYGTCWLVVRALAKNTPDGGGISKHMLAVWSLSPFARLPCLLHLGTPQAAGLRAAKHAQGVESMYGPGITHSEWRRRLPCAACMHAACRRRASRVDQRTSA